MKTKYGQGVWALTRAYALQQTDWFSARDVQRVLFDNAKFIDGESVIGVITSALGGMVRGGTLNKSQSRMRNNTDQRAYVKYKATQHSKTL
jgi:hypothetical protein